jgi:hypothetical protein
VTPQESLKQQIENEPFTQIVRISVAEFFQGAFGQKVALSAVEP